MRSLNKLVMDGLSAATDQNSDPIPARWFDNVSLVGTLASATTPDCVLKFQGSNDAPENGNNYAPSVAVSNWADIPNGSVAFSANGSQTVRLSNISYRWLRAAWVYTSGTGGTISVRFTGSGPS